jgi:hypothetical protein
MRAWRRLAVALCALCLAGAMAGAVAMALSTPKHRHLAPPACRLHHHKHKHCSASPRRKPPSGAHAQGTVAVPGSSGGTATSGAPSASGSGGSSAGSTENPAGQAPPALEPGAGGVPSPLAHLQVSAKEFSLTLSRPNAQAGRILVELVNAGQDEHNLHIRPAGGGPDVGAVGIVLPGHHSDVEFHLQPGTHTLYRAVPAHEELGMKATFTVQ